MKDKKIQEIINFMKEVDINGETMEDILEEVGLREQVVYQILDSEKYVSAEKTWNDIFNNEVLIYDNFIDYYTDKHIS
jgi:hypothetical protein